MLVEITTVMAPPFAGWYFLDGDLCDPDGNRYRPNDLRAVHWVRQAWAARAGYPGELRFMRAELASQLQAAARPLLVEVHRIGWDGSRHLLGSLWVPASLVPDPRPCEALPARVARG